MEKGKEKKIMSNNNQEWEKKVQELIEQIRELQIYISVNNCVFEENISLKEKIQRLEEEIQLLKETINKMR
jgi:hypothetical protein